MHLTGTALNDSARPRGAARAARRHHQFHRRRRAKVEAAGGGARDHAIGPRLLLERGEVADGGEHRDVLEAYRMFAYDRGWVHRLEEAVATGLTAEAAVERVQSDSRARMLRATDPYLRERLHDLDELANRLMHQITGQDHAPARERLPENAVLVARSMGPAALLDYDRKRLRGLVLEEGGPNSRRDRGARARHRGGRRDRQRHRHRRPGRRHHRRWLDRRARAPLARHGRLYRAGATAGAPAAQYLALRDKPCATKDGENRADDQCRAGVDLRISRRPAPPASA
jgi:phosphotransferase system enzyme I (PtsP)